MRKILLVFTLLVIASSAFPQRLKVETFKILKNDLSAMTQPRKDLNDRNCALVKVGLGLQDAQFEGSVIGNIENKTGEYWVYMPQGNRQLKVKHPNYAPVMVTFADYGVDKLESNQTYELIVTAFNQYANAPKETPLLPASQTVSIPVKDNISIEMVRIEAGTFTMGATPEMKEPLDWEKPAHQVTLSNDYYIGKYEVTQALWQAVMGYNPSNFKGDDLPVENVSWNVCQLFISKLNSMTGRMFRLPTEAEWEYAARGGNKSNGCQYSGSNNISDIAWCEGYSKESQTHPVGSKMPNELGIYDMNGNVYEWCQDWYYIYSSSPQTNPKGTSKAAGRVCRGGSWCDSAWSCRLSSRNIDSPEYYDNEHGLRLVLSE